LGDKVATSPEKSKAYFAKSKISPRFSALSPDGGEGKTGKSPSSSPVGKREGEESFFPEY
jgi:hypothetical protein